MKTLIGNRGGILMRRVLISALLACLFLTVLIVPAAVAQEKIKLTLASMKTFGIDTMPLLIRRFEKLHPNIEVEFVEMPSPNYSTEIHQYLVTTLAGETGDIDVFTIDCIWFPEFGEAGWLLNMDPYIAAQEKANYFKGAIETVSYKGHQVGMPWYIDAGMLYYRKDLLDKYGFKPPKTWDELIHQAQVILKGEKNPNLHGFIWQGRQAEVLVCDLVEFLGSDGAVLDDKGNVVINNEAGLRAAQLMYDLIYKYKITPESVNTYDEEPSRQVFTSGNAIFLRNWSYVWNIAQDPKESKVVGKVGIAPIPAFKGSKSASCLGGYQFAVNKYSEHPKEAAELAKFLSSPESQLYFAQKISFAPTRPAVYDNAKLAKQNPFLVSLKDVFVYATPRPIHPRYPEISLILQSEFSKLLTNKQTPKQTVDAAAAKIKALLKK
ncbi:MAG TPA: ABC transporter substrate-binding protein [Firmicutes bacterium]|nr:ABC transporter substrate-binding protein [Bacillota bacterium]